MSQAELAFHWIIDLLEKNQVAYQVTGGLAVRGYGSDRPLADIDLDIPEAELPRIQPWVKDYIEFGPIHFKDGHWDLDLMRLNYNGQEIDLGGAFDAQVFNQASRKWEVVRADFSTAIVKTLFGRQVPVIAKAALIDYKRKLARPVDLLDVAFLES